MAFNFFNKPAANSQQGQQGQQGQSQNTNNPQNQGNGQNQGGSATLPNQGNNGQPVNNGQNAQNQPPANPLDMYSKMFDNPATEGDKSPTFAIDPKIMDSVVSSQDFMQGVDPELLQKATTGDTQALLQIINSVGRNAYRASIEHGGMLTDKFVGAKLSHEGKSLGSKVRQELTMNTLSNTPNFQHPVVKKQLTEIAQRLQQANPEATPEEVAKAAKEYITELSRALNPDSDKQGNGSNTTPAAEERGEEYWNNFFDNEPKS
jgi:hypothetical protein